MSDKLFPKAKCIEILNELSSWTSVADLMVAARILEQRTVPSDQPESLLVMPVEYAEDEFEQIFKVLLGYLIDGYVTPSAKVAVCRALDPLITEETETILKSLRLRPTVRLGTFPKIYPKRAFLIEDQPAVIELIRAPLNCLMGLYLNSYEFTRGLRDMATKAQDKTGGRPTIFHRPYADACLPSFVEALCFFLLGLDVGTRFASPGHTSIDSAYRAVNVQMVPPVEQAFMEFALQVGQETLDALR